ncbi:Transcriptional regulator MntR [Candidatus Tiddalikarchaeum anstoanum]|nr:Transcriptional regulator MntR [Candidatus Tiddalikarchaeum anstoanum]
MAEDGSKAKSLVKLFLRDKPASILRRVYTCADKTGKCYASVIAKDVDCTYSHTVRIIQTFEKEGLLVFKKDGRIKTIQLTKKGTKIAETLIKLVSLMNED